MEDRVFGLQRSTTARTNGLDYEPIFESVDGANQYDRRGLGRQSRKDSQINGWVWVTDPHALKVVEGKRDIFTKLRKSIVTLQCQMENAALGPCHNVLIGNNARDVLIIFFVRRLLKSQTPTEGRRAMRGAYLSASLGLLAFLVSALFS